MGYDYVAEPTVVGDESESPTLAVGFPMLNNPVLLWKHHGGEDGDVDYEEISELDDDTVDNLIEELDAFREQSQLYRDNE